GRWAELVAGTFDPVGDGDVGSGEAGHDEVADPPGQLQQYAADLVDVGHGVVGGAVAAEPVLDDRAVVVPGRAAGHGCPRHPGVVGPGQGDDEVSDGVERVGPGHALEGAPDRHAGGDEGV